MTYEEAVEWLKLDIELTQFDPMTGEAAHLNNNSIKVLNAEKIAIEVLNKQIAKKPYRDSENHNFWICPTCKTELYWDTDYGQQKFKFCNECGQHLDWSE